MPNETKIYVTDLSYFDDCRRQWLWYRNWNVRRPEIVYWIGNVVHAGLDGYYRRGPEYMLPSAADFTSKSLTEMEGKFPNLWAEYQTEIEDAYSLAIGMLQNYAIYDESNPLGGQVVGVEKRLNFAFERPKGVVRLAGRVDLITERDDGVWIVDHKTAGSKMNTAGLDVDEQLSGYAYLFWRKYGEVPSALLYNILYKVLPAEPYVLKDGGLSKAKDQTTTFDIYMAALTERGLDPMKYADILSSLQSSGWSKFFQRDGSTRNLKEIMNFERRFLAKADLILDIVNEPETWAFPSPTTSRCGYCPFLGACKSCEDGGNYEAILEAQFDRNV